MRITTGAVFAAVLAALPSALTQPASDPSARVLDVDAYEYALKAPDSIAAGVVTVRLVDHGKVSHQAILARLDDTSSLARVMKTLTDDKVHTTGIRLIGGVETARAGESAETILALRPGRYVILCSYEGDNGHTHVAMGMIRPLVVTAGAATPSMALPPAPVTIRLSDYRIAVTGTLHSGRQLVRVENVGQHRHHLNLTRFRGDATLDDAMNWDGKSQPAPLLDTSGGAAAMEPGETSVVVLHLEHGRYELACVMSNDGKSKPHYMLGMHDEVTIASR